MANLVRFARAMPVPMVEDARPRDVRYNSEPFRKGFEVDSYGMSDYKEVYHQKWQKNDFIHYQTNIPDDTTLSLSMLDCATGKVVVSFIQRSRNTLPGNLYQGTLLSTVTYRIGLGIPDGIYRIRQITMFADSTEMVHYSEPISVREYHPGTRLLQYRHHTNRTGLIFDNLVYNVRVEMWREEAAYQYQDTDYTDQRNEHRLLSSRIGRRFTYEIGARSPLEGGPQPGVAMWMIDILSEAMQCRELWVDDEPVSRPAGEVIETTKVGVLRRGTIDLVAVKQSESITSQSGNLLIAELPTDNADYPIALAGSGYLNTDIRIGDDTRAVTISQLKILENLTAVSSWIAGLNAATGALNIGGVYQFNAGRLEYVNAPGEGFNNTNIVIYPHALIVPVTAMQPGDTLLASFSGGEHIRDFGDGFVWRVFAPGLVEPPVNYTYSSPGQYNLRIFHRDNITRLTFNSLITYGVSGRLPVGLEYIRLSGSLWFTGFDFDILTRVNASLRDFRIIGTAMSQIGGNPWAPGRFPWIQNFNVSGNRLDDTDLQQLIAGYISCGTFPNTGPLWIADQQTPPAPPSPTTLAYYQQIQGAGGYVQHD